MRKAEDPPPARGSLPPDGSAPGRGAAAGPSGASPGATGWPSLLAMTAGVLFGGAVVATRFVVQESDPLTVVTLRYLIGFFFLLPLYLLPSQQSLGIRRFSRRDLLPITLLGVLFFGLIPFTFTVGLNYTYASRGGLVLAFGPLFTLLLASLARVEPLTASKLLGALCAIAGAALALGLPMGGGPVPAETLWRGDGYMLLTTLLFAVYNVFSHRYLQRYQPLSVILHSLLSGTVFLLCAYLIVRGMLPWGAFSLAGWGALLFIGIPGGAVGFAMYILALGRLSPARAAVFYNLNPVSAVALGAFLLGEPLSLQFWAGFALVIGGILLAQRHRFGG